MMGIKLALIRWLAPYFDRKSEIDVEMNSAGALKVNVPSFRKSRVVKRQISALRNQKT